MRDYDPDAMFPRKPKPKSRVDGKAIRWIIITALAAMAIWVGAGCKNVRSIDAGFGGLEVEDWPSHPSQEDKSIFDFGMTTNRLNAVPANWDAPANWKGPLLMPMEKK